MGTEIDPELIFGDNQKRKAMREARKKEKNLNTQKYPTSQKRKLIKRDDDGNVLEIPVEDFKRRKELGHLPKKSEEKWDNIFVHDKSPNHSKVLSGIRMAEAKARIAMLYNDDITQAEIARIIQEEFGLESFSMSQVAYQIKRMLEYWRKVALKNIDQKQAMALTRLQQIEDLALDAYFRSMEGKVTTYQEQSINELKSSKKKAQEIREAVKIEAAQYKEQTTNGAKKVEEKEWDIDPTVIEKVLVETGAIIKKYERIESNAAGNPKFLDLMLKCNQERCRIWGIYTKSEDVLSPEQEFAALSDVERTSRLQAILQKVSVRANTNIEESKAHSNSEISTLAKPAPLGGFIDDESEEEEQE